MKPISRLRFLKHSAIVGGLLGWPAASLLAEQKCSIEQLTPEELMYRYHLRYQSRSPFPSKRCSQCALFVDQTIDGACRYGCNLFPGPISPDGYCDVWVSRNPDEREQLKEVDTDDDRPDALTVYSMNDQYFMLYVIQQGDVLSKIAVKTGVNGQSILDANPDIKWHRIRPGDQIRIPVRIEKVKAE